MIKNSVDTTYTIKKSVDFILVTDNVTEDEIQLYNITRYIVVYARNKLLFYKMSTLNTVSLLISNSVYSL